MHPSHSPRFARPSAGALGLLGVLTLAAPSEAQDAERSTHSDEASTPQVSFEERGPDHVLRQYQLGCLSQLTYLIGSRGEALVVDPQRDVEHYLRDARELGFEIRKVLLTHTNADFVAGHTELRHRTGAEILISAASDSRFPHTPLADGDRLRVGALEIEAWATPGHTLDAMTFLVRVPGKEPQPAFALTGDTLFIGGIGRPDLVGGEATPALLAGHAFDSLRRLKALPDATLVLPAHGAGSLCGAHLSPETVSTIGRERATNPYLGIDSRARFVARVVSGLPIAPPYFRHNVELNRAGPPVVDWSADLPPAWTPAEVERAQSAGAWIVDVREADEYAAGHVAGAVNVALRGRLDTWTGTVVPFDADLVLVGSAAEVREAVFRLRRIGFDRVRAHLAGGMAAWRAAGLAERKSELLTPAELAARIAAGDEPMIVDVRSAAEALELRLGDYAHVALPDFESFGHLLDRHAPVVFVCNSAYRSSMAVGLAERAGFERVGSLAGGLDAWIDAGYPVYGSAPICAAPDPAGAAAGPAADRVAVPASAPRTPAPAGPSAAAASTGALLLPEPMDVAALARALTDQSALHAVFDVRPAWQFAEFHLPGAVNVEHAALAAKVAALPAGVRAVVVDRDGTLAFALAALVQQAEPGRSVRVLLGGTTAWWRERAGGTPAAALPALPAAAGAAAATPPAAPVPETQKPAARKRSAGC
ncbi:MAG: MBL fold metallo-hydrolase [Planctomycetes bacterium]|nr:MBL fold metallo-hydrolase [Planctomycetota bacterium]